jgi:hypothetical protein
LGYSSVTKKKFYEISTGLMERLRRSMLVMEALSFFRCCQMIRSLISIRTFKMLISKVGTTLIRICKRWICWIIAF